MLYNAGTYITPYPVVEWRGNNFWGGSKPRDIRDVNVELTRRNFEAAARIREHTNRPLVIETELIDSPEFNEQREIIDYLGKAFLGPSPLTPTPRCDWGVFDQSGGHVFAGFHPESAAYHDLCMSFLLVQPIGPVCYCPLYVTPSRLELIKKRGLSWFAEVIEGRRSQLKWRYAKVVLTVHHTTIHGVQESGTITADQQASSYIGDDVWSTLLQSGDCVWWSYGNMELFPRALDVAREAAPIARKP